MRELNKNGKLPFRYSKIGRWRGKNSKRIETEIDIMAIDNKAKYYIIGECKFRNKLFDISDFNDLKAKYIPADDSKIYYYLFSKSGFADNLLELQNNSDNIFIVNLADIINYEI